MGNGKRERGTVNGNEERGTGNKEQRNGKRGMEDAERGTGNGERGMRKGEQGTENGERETENGEPDNVRRDFPWIFIPIGEVRQSCVSSKFSFLPPRITFHMVGMVLTTFVEVRLNRPVFRDAS